MLQLFFAVAGLERFTVERDNSCAEPFFYILPLIFFGDIIICCGLRDKMLA